jgi:transcriptional regulator with XRE-family HTH domain
MNDENTPRSVKGVDANSDREALKRKRLTLGLTQYEYAKKIGISATELGRWERGVKEIPEQVRSWIFDIE